MHWVIDTVHGNVTSDISRYYMYAADYMIVHVKVLRYREFADELHVQFNRVQNIYFYKYFDFAKQPR